MICGEDCAEWPSTAHSAWVESMARKAARSADFYREDAQAKGDCSGSGEPLAIAPPARVVDVHCPGKLDWGLLPESKVELIHL